MVHGGEYVLVHHVDLQAVFCRQRFQHSPELIQIGFQFVDHCQHDHAEHIVHNSLVYINDIGVILGAHLAYFCQDSYFVFPNYCDNRFQMRSRPFLETDDTILAYFPQKRNPNGMGEFH